MSFLDRLLGRRGESRQGVTFTQADPHTFAELVGLLPKGSGAIVNVNHATALSVPSIFGAVNFISGEIASLPLHVYERNTNGGRIRVRGPVADMLDAWPNEEMHRFAWLKYKFERVLTQGRCVTNIQNNLAGRTRGLMPLPPSAVEVARRDGRLRYDYRENQRKVTYAAREVIDLWFGLEEDGVRAVQPIAKNKNTIALAIASTLWAHGVFAGGGVPPFVVHGNFRSMDAVNRASSDIEDAIKKAQSQGRQVITLPDGLKLDVIGLPMDKAQWVEINRFLIEEIARIYSLPPVFLQDLTHGTFSNTEQQDLHFVKHTLRRWIEHLEQEINLKLFRGSNRYAEFQVDALLRGDFTTRMEGYSTAIQNAILKPAEARERENLPPAGDEADQLHIQGGTVPIGTQPKGQGGTDPTPPADDDNPDGEDT